MNDKDFEEFKKRDFCNDDELLELTEEQMNEIANTDARVKSYGRDQKSQSSKRRYALKRHQKS